MHEFKVLLTIPDAPSRFWVVMDRRSPIGCWGCCSSSGKLVNISLSLFFKVPSNPLVWPSSFSEFGRFCRHSISPFYSPLRCMLWSLRSMKKGRIHFLSSSTCDYFLSHYICHASTLHVNSYCFTPCLIWKSSVANLHVVPLFLHSIHFICSAFSCSLHRNVNVEIWYAYTIYIMFRLSSI